MERRWNKAWQDLPQKTLQKWVERIPHHIQAIIASKGGNEYCEAIPGYKRSWKGDRVKGILSTHSFIDPDRSAGHLTPVVVAEQCWQHPHRGLADASILASSRIES
jgi:hypothetical protein